MPGQRYIAGFAIHGRATRFVNRSPKLQATRDKDRALRFVEFAKACDWASDHVGDFLPYNPVVVDLDDLGA